jgi:hypothetical protein
VQLQHRIQYKIAGQARDAAHGEHASHFLSGPTERRMMTHDAAEVYHASQR